MTGVVTDAQIVDAESTRPQRSASEAAKDALSSRTASIVALVIAVIWTIPTFGLLVSSFRPEEDVKTSGWWTIFTNPSFTLQNYKDVLSGGSSQESLYNNLINSIVITIPAVLIPISLATLAAYAFAWMDFKGKYVLFIAVFALQIVPIQVTLVPLLPILSILACGWLMLNLSGLTWIRFGLWMVLGIVIYLGYGRRHSVLARREAATSS